MATKHPRIMHVVVLFLFSLVLSGCTAVAVGIGVGAGVAAYASGERSRTYEAEYHRAVSASMDTLLQLKIPPAEKIGDELKTEIRANRADGSPVNVEVERIDSQRTQISIRVGPIGIMDREVSNQIHQFIEKKLLHDFETPGTAADNSRIKLRTLPAKQPAREQASIKSNPPEPDPNTVTREEREAVKIIPAATADPEKQVMAKFIIFFNQDSNMLHGKSREKLGEIAALISKNPAAHLMITGYSDPKGSADYRKMLSERRANTVKLCLVANGMNPSRSQIVAQSAAGRLPNQGAVVEISY